MRVSDGLAQKAFRDCFYFCSFQCHGKPRVMIYITSTAHTVNRDIDNNNHINIGINDDDDNG